ncbi:bifunctional DNA primase/polymerase [Streptomyces sp. NPDC054956]
MGLHLFPADHPYLTEPACLRMHHPDQIRTERAKGTAHPRGKHPSVKWSATASNDPSAAARWYGAGLRNIGIACAPSGLLVLDDDTGTALADLCADHDRDMPQTFTVATRAGRQHFYFRQPQDVLGNGLGALAGRGFDVRGGVTATSMHGGYVIAPGSRHETSAVYTTLDWDAEIIPLPGWIESLLRAASHTPRRARGGGRVEASDLVGVLAKLLDQGEGNRNNLLWWAACRCAEAVLDGVDEDAVGDVLATCAEQVGLTAWEARNALARAIRTVARGVAA